MIYSPSRFCFIHVPRTSGMAITLALAGRLTDACVVTTGLDDLPCGWWRHSRACQMASQVPWGQLWRWAVIRSPWEIVGSTWLLARKDAAEFGDALPSSLGARHYWHVVYAAARMEFADWIRWHFDYLADARGFWNYWCCGADGTDLGVEPIRFDHLPAEWPRICERLGVVGLPLPHTNGAPGFVAWTPAAVDLVGKLCADDVARFGFARPTAPTGGRGGVTD